MPWAWGPRVRSSVCPSVCNVGELWSHSARHWRLCGTFDTAITLVLWHQQWLAVDAPFRLKFALRVTHPLRKKLTLTDSTYNVLIVRDSEKSLIITNTETLTWTPKIVSIQSCCIPCLKNNTALACYVFDIYQPILILLVDNKVILLSTVCKYFSLSYVVLTHTI